MLEKDVSELLFFITKVAVFILSNKYKFPHL